MYDSSRDRQKAVLVLRDKACRVAAGPWGVRAKGRRASPGRHQRALDNASPSQAGMRHVSGCGSGGSEDGLRVGSPRSFPLTVSGDRNFYLGQRHARQRPGLRHPCTFT